MEIEEALERSSQWSVKNVLRNKKVIKVWVWLRVFVKYECGWECLCVAAEVMYGSEEEVASWWTRKNFLWKRISKTGPKRAAYDRKGSFAGGCMDWWRMGKSPLENKKDMKMLDIVDCKHARVKLDLQENIIECMDETEACSRVRVSY